MNGTLQGRLPNELRLHGIKTKEDANRFLKDVYIKEHNKRFAVKAEEPGSAFVPVQPHINLDLIFSIKAERVVNYDNTISFENLTLQIESSRLRVSFAKCRVTVHRHLDQTLSVAFGPHLLGHYDAHGKFLNNLFRRAA